MALRHLSLRYKFLFLLASVLLATTAAYLGIAMQVFNKDKKAYILDNNAALAESIGEEIASDILSSLKTMRLAALAATAATGAETTRAEAVTELFDDDDNFVALSVLRRQSDGELTPLITKVNAAYLSGYQRDSRYIDQLTKELPLLPQLRVSGASFRNAVAGTGPPLVAADLAIRRSDESRPSLIVRAFLRQDRRVAAFQRSSVYTTSLIDGLGNVLGHSDIAQLMNRANLAADPGVQHVLASAAAVGAYEYSTSDGTEKILAYKKLGIGGLAVISEISKEKAFYASRKLVERSTLLAILVLALAFIPSILFTRRLTAALQRLSLATLKIAKGEFNIAVEPQSEDEVGALSRSFNRMAREINRLLIETADKARMEKELETAQLVQDNFFPREDLRFGAFDVAAYFKPASECGGDWWGSIHHGDHLILLIGDATGHGVPAALMTAAAHSCATTLTRLAEKQPGLVLTPAFIMDSLNAAIFHAGRGRVKMTFFVAAVDCRTGALTYANASHEQPLIRHAPAAAGPATRADLTCLTAKPDPCLGEGPDTVYHDHTAVIAPGDTFLLYTDGVTECRNAAKEEYGERRLTRSLLQTAGYDAAHIKEHLIGQTLAFRASPAQEDDVTLIVVKRAVAQTVDLTMRDAS